MKQIRYLLLAGTVISAAALSFHPASVLAANDALLIAQAPPPPAEEVPPEEQKKEEQKKKEEPRQERQQRREERQQQKQDQREQRQQQREERQQQKQEKREQPAAEPKREERQQRREEPPPPRVEKEAPDTKQAPETKEAPAADERQQKREERRDQRREERREERREQRGDTPPVPPVPDTKQRGDTPPVPPIPDTKQRSDTPPVPDSKDAPAAGEREQRREDRREDRREERREERREQRGDTPPVPQRGDQDAAREGPSTEPAPPPQGEQPAIPPEELRGERTPEQNERRARRLEQEFESRDRRFDERFDRRVERRGDRTIIREGDDRVIIRDGGRVIIRSDETERLRRNARDYREERRGNEYVTVIRRPNGVEIVTVKDEDGNLIRRIRRENGREVVIIDNRRAWERGGRWDRDRGWRDHDRREGFFIGFDLDLPPVRVDIPQDEYIVEADEGSYEEFEEVFDAPPLVATERPYSLQEVTQNVRLRERVRSVDLNTVTFATGDWRVSDDQVATLEDIARAMLAVIEQNPNAVYLIEGHTDAVGSALDNLSLSDRRAEEVAALLTEHYDIPAENLVTQGYGEDYLRVNTEAANERNRRVTIRNITGLLNTEQAQNAPPQ